MIPSYVANKPKPVQDKWLSIKKQYSVDSDAVGIATANKWLASYKPLAIENFVFKADKEQIVQRSIGGVNYFDFLLADTRYDDYGTKYSEDFLKKIANIINDGKVSLTGDFNHETLKLLQEQGVSNESIKEKLHSLKQGVAKGIKAIYDKGRLYLRTLVDQKYHDRVMKAKGVSIEGSFVREGDTFVDGMILGFSFIDAKDKNLGNPRARRLK